VQRVLQHVRNLRAHGYNPIVLTVPSEEYNNPCSAWRCSVDPQLLADLPSGLEIHRVSSRQPYGLFGLLRRSRLDYLRDLLFVPDAAIRWVQPAVRCALQIARQQPIDAVYVSVRPHSAAFIGARLNKLLGTPWTLDFRDPWTQYFLARFPTWWHYRVEQSLEQSLVRQADHVVTITPTARANLLQWCEFLEPERVSCITNGFADSEFTAKPRPPHHDGVFRILYSGNFCGGPEDSPPPSRNVFERIWRGIRQRLEYTPRQFDRVAHSPRFLLDAMKALFEEEPSLRAKLRFVHIGPSGPAHMAYVRKLGLEHNVEFCGFVPHAEAVQRIAEADALFFCLADSPTGERNDCIPQKAFEYIAARRPVLALTPPGDAHDLFVESGMAEVCPPRDIPAIVSALRRLMQSADRMRPNEAFRSRFDRRSLTKQLAAILDGLTSREPGDKAAVQ
jgi:glycosyltransferase involved in cell wall biosynthesis